MDNHYKYELDETVTVNFGNGDLVTGKILNRKGSTTNGNMNFYHVEGIGHWILEQMIVEEKDYESVENLIMNKTSEIWNLFLELDQTHPSDINDLADAIHDIQKIIAVRITRRTRSDIFITKESKK